jgi:quercetin dioxygenase-like cupin family protein
MNLPRFVKTDLTGRFYKAQDDFCIDIDLMGSNSHLYIFPIESGQKVETHVHAEGIHFIFVRTGKVKYTVGDVTMISEPGDFITIPPNTPHKFEAVDGESTSVVAFDVPVISSSLSS